ncbi:hypothetical protein Xen7305DRAFT_00014170 [Xenococcus sp. PCC 7305]|nr:hypothetical protein Xen7305DRAFT_00014170 [Xenococcus sp. PCC 7305]
MRISYVGIIDALQNYYINSNLGINITSFATSRSPEVRNS